ncbi:predicted protein [Histoplasma capsulatum var. duboisii H88]|uniref:Predicted protein n=1 Tax=Ajellomyces capsulatus (strain H88) TaxID=544711 RepID=F0UA52_AJEC8|nr:predicted protein [Histoplasma capsulatum var. duboisii H88]
MGVRRVRRRGYLCGYRRIWREFSDPAINGWQKKVQLQLQLQLRLRLRLQLLNALVQFAHIYYIYISTSIYLHLHLHLPDRTLIADWPLIGRRQKPQRVLFSSCQGFWNMAECLGAETLLCQHLAADLLCFSESERPGVKNKSKGDQTSFWANKLNP